MRTIEEIEQRKNEIIAESESASNEQLDALGSEMDALKEERAAIDAENAKFTQKAEERKAKLAKIASGETPAEFVENPPEERDNKMDKILTPDMPEYRDIFMKSLMGKPLNEVEKREYETLGTGLAVVPTATSEKIFDSMTKIAPMLNEITLLRVAGGLRFAVQGARAAAAVHVQNAPTGLAADTLTTITLGGFEFIKILSISASMSTMSVGAFENWLVKILAEDLAIIIDNEIINTANTTGGIVDGPGGGWVDGTNQITYVPGNGLSHANVMALIALLPSAYDANAKFLMNKATFWGQFAAMEDANGNPIINPDLAAPGKYMVRGYPVLIDDNVAANEAYLGDFSKVVGNLSQDIKIDKSTDAGFLNNSTYFRGTAIFDCDVADPAAIVKLNV